MKTHLSSDNPYRYNRSGYAWEMVPAGGAAHLDFGCHDAAFLNNLRGKDIARLVGVDVSREAIIAGESEHPDLDLLHLTDTVPLPFDDRFFTSITLLDVIEHVAEQGALLDEVHRVLADDGVLIVTVPGQHLFSFLDLGNWKFRFPRVHRWYYSRKHSPKEYEYRYVSNPDGLVGDISGQKRWHEHFSRNSLRRLLAASGFGVEGFDGSGFFVRGITIVGLVLKYVPPFRTILGRLAALDNKCFESTHLFCRARKQAGHTTAS